MTGSVKKHVKQAIPAYVILIVIFVIMSMVSPSFRKIGNYRNIVTQTAVLAIVSIAQCNVLLIGGIGWILGLVGIGLYFKGRRV